MPFNYPPELDFEPTRTSHVLGRLLGGIVAISAFAAFSAAALTPPKAMLLRSVDVKGSTDAVWAKIGAFCAIKDWHPAIGTCSEDGKTPATRTLVTRDGAATFIELQTAHNDAAHTYSYTFTSAPVPVTHYASTFRVLKKSADVSTVVWSGEYIPDAGKEKVAADALTGIYESGLAAIKAKLGG